MKILCTGLTEKYSGKTTLSLSLINYLKERGDSVYGFKPKAGNNLWYHWEMVCKSLAEGTLYGKDVYKYYEVCEENIPISILNPIHRLWIPESQEAVWERLPNFLLDRVTVKKKQYILINTKCKIPIEEKYFHKLFQNSEFIKILTRKDLTKITPLYEKADNRAYSYLSNNSDHIICESYADVGLPWMELKDLDLVFVIKPFHIAIYEGERYLAASKVVSSISIEQKTEEIIEPIKPLKTIKVPPFTGNVIEKLKNHISIYLTDLL
ncbi:MAG: putative p-loop ATPase/GTPase-like protein [Promethearchaeota archaeon]|nr:MAG: putative p-loop ATPase/GTPase-like protein [Candidatus Lokiarchaeota archaeon]